MNNLTATLKIYLQHIEWQFELQLLSFTKSPIITYIDIKIIYLENILDQGRTGGGQVWTSPSSHLQTEFKNS